MSLFRRIFGLRSRRALEAEAQGDLRAAARRWIEAGDRERAAALLVRLGERATGIEERVQAWVEALDLLPEEDRARRLDLEARIGLAVLEAVRAQGAISAESRRRLADAAVRLERAQRWVEAADCFERLGRTEDVARCLQQAGEVEKLERVLEASVREHARQDRLRSLLSEQEQAQQVGARDAARRALREAAALAPEDPAIATMLRRLDERWPRGRRLRLRIGERVFGLVGRLPVVIGRADADVLVRGASVSRRHCEVDRSDVALLVRDLGSRNGTLVSGVPIAGQITLGGPTEIGLGEDVVVRVGLVEPGVEIEVVRGLDRGERIVAGPGDLRIAGVPATFAFEEDCARLSADPGAVVLLGAQRVVAPIDLLVGDVITVAGERIEVLA